MNGQRAGVMMTCRDVECAKVQMELSWRLEDE